MIKLKPINHHHQRQLDAKLEKQVPEGLCQQPKMSKGQTVSGVVARLPTRPIVN
jgi:hypothetical protein